MNSSSFCLIVKEYSFDGNKLSLELSGDENLVANYYIKSYEEFLHLSNNIKYGVTLSLRGQLKEPSNNTVPNVFNYKKYLSNKDIFYILNVDDIEILDDDISYIYKLKNKIVSRISEIDTTGYMKAFIIGEKDIIDDYIYKNYQKIGVTHLFALSGMHVGLLSGIILKLLKKIGEVKKYIIVDILLVIYGFIVGFPSSIKRCILFFIFNSFNKIFKFDISSLKLLLLVVFTLVIYDFKIIYDVGFIYSVITVGGIIISNDFISCDNKVISSFKLSLVAFLFSLPISLMNFYEVNLLSVFYNIFFIPYVTVVVYPLSLLCFIFPFLSDVFIICINVMEYVSNYLSSVDFFCLYLNFNIVEVIFYYIALFITFYKNNFFFICFDILIILFDLFFPYFDGSCYVYFFDVGQGDSSLVITPFKNETILIDTGGKIDYFNEEWKIRKPFYVSNNYISFLKSFGIRSIDYFVISHGDYDHMGDAINLVENFKVEKVIFNCGEFNELEQNLIKVLNKKKIPYYSCIKELNIDDNKLYFLNNEDYGNENDNSSVIYTELNNHKFLFMGDAGVEVEEDLIEKYNLENIDVLKVGHHGSKTSSSKNFINEINPIYSIISVGRKNRYGHPNNEVLNILDDSKIYRTDLNGSIIFRIKNNKLEIQACMP